MDFKKLTETIKIAMGESKISQDNIKAAEKVLVDNGIDADEADTVLQAIGYALLDIELYPDINEAEENLDELIEDEFELIRDALRQYSELDDCFMEGYVTIEDIKNNYGLQDFTDASIIECAKEEGYEVDGDKILDPCA